MFRPSYGRSLWRDMDRLRHEMDRAFSLKTGSRMATAYPAMNVWTNEDSAIVTAELPGVVPDEINISVQGDTLSVRGRREYREMEEGETYHRRERGSGSFSRTFQLPFQIEANQVEASYEKGVLQIKLPRAESDKPKRITVKGG